MTTKRIRDVQGEVYHSTSSAGATAEFRFTGTGVEILAQKYQDGGEIAVLLDGQPRGKVNLKLKNFPRLIQVPVLRVEGLPDGAHTMKIESKGAGIFALDGFRVLR